MNFFSMAVNNIKKKSDTYFTYFLSTAFAVTIFYIFCSIYYNPEFESFHTGITKIGILFKISSMAVLFFASIFVYYANSLFIKSRKKEIAIFSLLGMKKKEIGRLLFLETFLVGLASIICGTILGCLFSRFFSMILKKLMLAGAPGNNLTFHLTWQPALLTFILFLSLFILNAFYSLKVIYKSKLIELLSAEKEGDTAPKFSLVSSIISIVLIAVSYIIFLNFKGDDGGLKLVGPAIFTSIMLAAGTYLLFQNVVIWLLSKCKKNDNFYYKTGNFISTSQLVYRIKANSNILCVVSLLSAFTISVMSAVISLYITLGDTMPVYAPYSYLCKNIDSSMEQDVLKAVKDDDVVQLHAVTDFDVLNTTAELDGYKVDTNNAYGKTISEVGKEFNIDVLKFSDYQKIVEDTERKELKIDKAKKGNKGAIFIDELDEGKCLFLDGNYGHEYSDNAKGKNVEVNTDSGTAGFEIIDVSLFKYMGSAYAGTTIIVNDADYDNYFKEKDEYKINHYTGLKFDNPLEVAELNDKISSIVPKEKHDDTYLGYHQILFNNYGAYIFIGIFLGVLFLMAAGSIIFYKQLMEARDDGGRYEILRKIGMSKKEVLSSVRRQIAAIFLLPFGVALVHSIVILITYRNMIYTVAVDTPVLLYAFVVVAAYFVIYALFYLLSVNGYMKTVWREDKSEIDKEKKMMHGKNGSTANALRS